MWSRKVKGNRSSLFCLHGWAQTHKNLEPLANLLKVDFDPFLFDLPGFGKSPPPPAVWSTDDYADHLIAYMDNQGIQQTSLLGHSFGGKIAMCLAERYPTRVKKLILLASSGLKPRLSLPKKIRRFGIRTSGRLIKAFDKSFASSHFVDHFIPRYGSKDYQTAGNMRSILVKSVNEDFSDRVKNIHTPTLLLWGEKDTETPIELGKRLAQQIPNSQLHIFPHHDHYLCDDVGAHLMTSYILPFLKVER